MKIVIDTSSLLSLVRYYLPFDTDNILYDFLKVKFETGELIVLDKVYLECSYVAKSTVINSLTYLNNKKLQIKTEDLLPSPKFFNQLEHLFINKTIRRKLSDVEFESRKNDFLESADAKLLLYCLNDKKKNKNDILLVTEETEGSNDNKSFKKLPAICKIIDIEVKTLPELMIILDDINLKIT